MRGETVPGFSSPNQRLSKMIGLHLSREQYTYVEALANKYKLSVTGAIHLLIDTAPPLSEFHRWLNSNSKEQSNGKIHIR